MAVYVAGLVLITGAVELVLALFVAARTSMPSPSSLFWPAYLGALIALVSGGGVLILTGLREIRRTRLPPEPSPL